MDQVQNLHPVRVDSAGDVDDLESPSPMDISVAKPQAHSLPVTSEEAELRVQELELAVDDLHRQSDAAADVHRKAVRRVRHRGVDPGGLDPEQLDARERDAEGNAAVLADLLGTRSDELVEAEAHAAQLRLPEPDTSSRMPPPGDLPTPAIPGRADVPPRLPPGPAVDISPSTAGFSTPVPPPLSPVAGNALDLLSSAGAPTEPPRWPLPGTDGGAVDTPYPPALPDTPLPGVDGSAGGPSYPAALADGPLPGAVGSAPDETH
jgi:hypothetical protein